MKMNVSTEHAKYLQCSRSRSGPLQSSNVRQLVFLKVCAETYAVPQGMCYLLRLRLSPEIRALHINRECSNGLLVQRLGRLKALRHTNTEMQTRTNETAGQSTTNQKKRKQTLRKLLVLASIPALVLFHSSASHTAITRTLTTSTCHEGDEFESSDFQAISLFHTNTKPMPTFFYSQHCRHG